MRFLYRISPLVFLLPASASLLFARPLPSVDARARLARHVPSARPAQSPSEARIEFSLLDEGQVSLNLYNSNGRIVREMLHAAPRPSGPVSLTWDGKDFAGRPLPAGDYTWKALSTRGLYAHFVTSLGTSPTPAWESWPGSYGGIFAVCCEAGSLFFGSYGPGTVALVKQSLSGKRDWVIQDAPEPWQGPIALGRSADKLYMLQPNGAIRCLDADTSESVGGFSGSWEAPADANKTVARAPEFAPALSPYSQPVDMTVWRDLVALSYYDHDAVRFYRASSGEQISQVKIPAPLGIAFTPGGKLLVVSGGGVQIVDPIGGNPQPLIGQIPDAYRIAVDAATGDILIAQQGVTQQVVRYSADGKKLKTYGAVGGRALGAYDSANFSNITSISADQSAGFVVAEASAPRRIARFDFAGHLVREWIGPQPPAPEAVVDPDDPSSAWAQSAEGRLVHYRLNLRSSSWTIDSVYAVPVIAGDRWRPTQPVPTRWRVRHRGDTTYLCESSPARIFKVDTEHGRLSIAAALATIDPSTDIQGHADSRDLGRAARKRVLWTDLNGDGTIDADEVVVLDDPAWAVGEPVEVDRALGIWALASDGARRLAVDHWAASGAPIYKPPTVMTFDRGDEPALAMADVELDDNGEIWTICSADMGAGKSLRGLVKWTDTGKMRFAAGVTQEPGRLQQFAGVAHGCIAVADAAAGDFDVWDTDGLWVGQLLEHPDLAAAPTPAYRLPSARLGGSLYTNPTTDDVFLAARGFNNDPVLRISGWTAWERHSGTVTLKR